MTGANGSVGWADGVKTQPVVLETENVYEVLKVETPVS
jgi:hypothetical protein